MNPANFFYSIPGMLGVVTLQKTRLAGCAVRLFKSDFQPADGVTLGELDGAQCNYDGYPAGGLTVAAWSGPVLVPGFGATITSPALQFGFATGGPGVGNVVGGFYLVTSDNVLWFVAAFGDGIPMQVQGQGFPLVISLGQGQG